MARTKRSAAATPAAAAATENAENLLDPTQTHPPPVKRARRSAKVPFKAADEFAPHDIDEPVPPPTTETVSVEEAGIDELAIAFPSTGSDAYGAYHLPKDDALGEVEQHLIDALKSCREGGDPDFISMPNGAVTVNQRAGIPEPSASDVLLHEQLVEAATYFPLPPELVEHHVDSATGRYIGPKGAVVAELSQVLIQPVMTGRRPVIDPNTSTYVYQPGYYGLKYEPFELALPPSTDPATMSSVTLNSFKSVEHTDPYFDFRTRVVRQGKTGERLNRASGFLNPFPIDNKEIHFRSLWVYPDSIHESLPVDVQPFVERQFTTKSDRVFQDGIPTTSDGVFHDGIRPDMMPFVQVVVRPIRGHKYPLPTDMGVNYTYMWSLYLRTDAINAAVESHDRAALAVIRNLLSLVARERNWLKFGSQSWYHDESIPSTTDPDISALPTSQPPPILSLSSSELNDTQRICLSWLLKRELLDDRTVNVFPSDTTINTHLVRLGPNGAYFEPFTSRFFTAAQRDSIRVLAQPEPSISVACTDSILKTSGPFCPHKVGIILALIQANPLQRPRPIPDLSRNLIPTRATLIVCTQVSLAEWAVQARCTFPGPGQVIVMDSSQDYSSVTLAQVQVADVVLASDDFMLSIYNRSLSHMVNSEHTSAPLVSLMPNRGRLRDPMFSCPVADSQSASLGPTDALKDMSLKHIEPKASRRRDYWDTLFETRCSDTGHAFLDRSPATTVSEIFTESLFAGPANEPPIRTPLHLLFWHRLVLDGVSFTTTHSAAAQEYRPFDNKVTPLHELASTSTVIIASRKASECTESATIVDTAAMYRTLGINLPDSPSDKLSVQGQADLIRSISLAIDPTRASPSLSSPVISVETVPVYPSLLEATRIAIVADLARDSPALTIRAIQHHLVPLNLYPRETSAHNTYPVGAASVMFDAYSATLSAGMPFHREWQSWHNVAVYRAKRRWPLYDEFLERARPDPTVDPKVVDDWMPDDSMFDANCAADMTAYDNEVRVVIRSVLSQTCARVLAKMRSSLDIFLETSPIVASRAENFDNLRAQLERTRDAGGDTWQSRIGEMCLERGFTLKEVEAIGMAVSNERRADAEDQVKSSWHWKLYSRNLALEDLSDISMGEWKGDLVKTILKLRQVLDLGRSVDWARQSVALANLVLLEGQTRTKKECPSCQRVLSSDAGAVARRICGFVGCQPCSTAHVASCDPCRTYVSVHHPSLIAQHHPVARQRIDDEWVQLLHSRDAVDSVHSFCSRLCGHKSLFANLLADLGGATTTNAPTFIDIFGTKIQAVVMYIHQQLAVDPTAKFVAFSQYTFQFHLLGLALHLVNIQAELIVDGASEYPPMLTFKTDPNVRVLVMPFSKCAAGVSLSEASHILFLHPFAGLSESPWGRHMAESITGYEQFAPAPTADVDQWNEDRRRVWGEWEKRCVEMVVKGKTETDQHAQVRIARFVIQHSIEEQLGCDASGFSQ